MTSNRDDLIGKIRALMSKTTVNGCSEAEALAALDKARALMDAYEVTEAELQLNKEETAILRSEPPGSSDPHSVKAFLARGVAEFCSCKAWKGSGQNGIVFCGLPSDARFATWLLDSLAAFVQAELARHLMGCLAPKNERRRIINGFVAGCCSRIGDRLDSLCAQSRSATTPNGRALAVIKNAAVDAKMEELGIVLRRCTSGKRVDDTSKSSGAVHR
jgi:hypothetical protein